MSTSTTYRPKNTSTSQSRTWTFTDWNVDRLTIFWKSVAVKHLWIGLEHSEEKGKHLQGTVVWLRPYRLSQLTKLVPGAHFEAAKMIDAENYCMKENLVLHRTMADEDEEKLKKERAWVSKDYKQAIIRDIKDGVCNKCLMDMYSEFMFSQPDPVFRWRYMVKYHCPPPWKKEEWCQQCGEHFGPRGDFSDRIDHTCMTCSKCSTLCELPYKRARYVPK